MSYRGPIGRLSDAALPSVSWPHAYLYSGESWPTYIALSPYPDESSMRHGVAQVAGHGEGCVGFALPLARSIPAAAAGDYVWEYIDDAEARLRGIEARLAALEAKSGGD